MEWYYILIIETISIVNLVGAIYYYAIIIEDCNYERDKFYLCDGCFEFRKPLHHSLYKNLNLFGKISFPILFTLIFPLVIISFLIYYIAMFIAVGIYLLCTFRPKKIDLFKVIKEGKKPKNKLSKKELVKKVDELRGLLDDERTENRQLENKLDKVNDDLYCANRDCQTVKNHNTELEEKVNNLTNEINNLHNYEYENQTLKEENEELKRLHEIDLKTIAEFRKKTRAKSKQTKN